MTYRILSREDCLQLIEERRTLGQERNEAAKSRNVSPRTIRENMVYYGLNEKWKAARMEYKRSVCDKAIRLRGKEGFTMEMIEEELGVKHDTIVEFMHQTGKFELYRKALHARQKVRSNRTKRRLDVAWLYMQRSVFGLSIREIAEQSGFSDSTVYAHIKKHKFKKASPKEAKKNRANAAAMFMNFKN